MSGVLAIWIDASAGARELPVFGMGLLERLLRTLQALEAPLREVRVELPERGPAPVLPAALAGALPLRFCREPGTPAERLGRQIRDLAGAPLLALSADTLVDPRLLRQLAQTSGCVAWIHGGGAVLRWEGEPFELAPQDGELAALAARSIASGAAKAFAEADFDGYLPNLRRNLPPWLLRITDGASRDCAERFLFASNYKGSTDFLTKYVYPPLVWQMVRPLARWRVHPNWLTALDWLAAFAVLPLFAAGAWLPGLTLAYLMTVLDSVDGKLARLTFRSSRLGEVLDHGLDIVHPPLWYLAWAWALGAGDPASVPFRAALWMLGLYIGDRLLAGAFKARHGVSIHGATPLDEKLRTFISRRNVNLALFSVALLADAVLPGLTADAALPGVTADAALPGVQLARAAFAAIVLWQALSFLFHAERVVQLWNVGRLPAAGPAR